jgi:hypothetical protein
MLRFNMGGQCQILIEYVNAAVDRHQMKRLLQSQDAMVGRFSHDRWAQRADSNDVWGFDGRIDIGALDHTTTGSQSIVAVI